MDPRKDETLADPLDGWQIPLLRGSPQHPPGAVNNRLLRVIPVSLH